MITNYYKFWKYLIVNFVRDHESGVVATFLILMMLAIIVVSLIAPSY